MQYNSLLSKITWNWFHHIFPTFFAHFTRFLHILCYSCGKKVWKQHVNAHGDPLLIKYSAIITLFVCLSQVIWDNEHGKYQPNHIHRPRNVMQWSYLPIYFTWHTENPAIICLQWVSQTQHVYPERLLTTNSIRYISLYGMTAHIMWIKQELKPQQCPFTMWQQWTTN